MTPKVFLTDGGIETDLIYRRGIDLPRFAVFPLLQTEAGRTTLRDYWSDYLAIARASGHGLMLEGFTWRANPVWGELLGYDAEQLARFNTAGIEFMQSLRGEHPDVETVIGGSLGPRNDGYSRVARFLSAEAREYHRPQMETFAAAGAELVTAYTMTHVDEAVGIVLAAREVGLPVSISFTIETDGRLPNGTTVADAINAVDAAAAPDYFQINCAHPNHLRSALQVPGVWRERIEGLRGNASQLSHAELDGSTEVDDGDPEEFARDTCAVASALPSVRILGGCCGTDARHLAAIASALRAGPIAPLPG